jgi:tRNA nucleotidyltransferase (CCA-adding enzyme)
MNMEIYMVGGAVRDRLLGRPVVDRDWVVVGATPEMMLAQGFKPVGKDFPVFLHPRTHEEYALARTERKTAPGYHGFSFHAAPDVTLEQDLARRDLTINAMAQTADGCIIDPYNGRADLAAHLLRHVSPAFSEDPVRILRIARFAARFGFSIAQETLQLMCRMVNDGEVDELVPERVWQEMSKALMTDNPALPFRTLRQCHALEHLLPELEQLFTGAEGSHGKNPGENALYRLTKAAGSRLSLPQRFAALLAGLKPGDCRDLARLAVQFSGNIAGASTLNAEEILELLRQTDALRRPERFRQLLQLVAVTAEAQSSAAAQSAWLEALLQAVMTLDAASIARNCSDKRGIAAAIDQARLTLIQTFSQTTPAASGE